MVVFFCFAFSIGLVEPSVRTYISRRFKQYVVISTAFISSVISLVAAILSASSAYFVKKDIENLSYIFCTVNFIALIAAVIPYFMKLKTRNKT